MSSAGTADGLVIGLDLDGVCADYITAMRGVVADRAGLDPAELAPASSWGFTEWGLNAEGFQAAHREAVNVRRVFKTLAPIEAAVETVNSLHDAGDRIRVVTNRLCDFVDARIVVADTVEWLQAQGLKHDELCFVADKSTVTADIYIDDAPHVLARLAAAGRTALVFDQAYNRASPGIRVRDWREARAAIDALRVAAAA